MLQSHCLSSDGVDFSDSLAGSRRGYVLELAGERSEETPVQKLTRLRCELSELADLLAAAPAGATPALVVDDVARLQKAIIALQVPTQTAHVAHTRDAPSATG
jgi:hypothetical protein